MEIIAIDNTNIESEHICCALSGDGADRKKRWMKQQFGRGLTFKRLDARGKAFIEYMPAENAWTPIEGDGYLFIGCFWVSGRFKGQGHADRLLKACKDDAGEKGKKGLAILSSAKKKPFLSDPAYLKYRGFQVCDQAAPYFELLYLPLEDGAAAPKFTQSCKEGETAVSALALFHTPQCPFTGKYVEAAEKIAAEKGIVFHNMKIDTLEKAKRAPSPFTAYSLFWRGHFVTHEILSEKKFSELLKELK